MYVRGAGRLTRHFERKHICRVSIRVGIVSAILSHSKTLSSRAFCWGHVFHCLDEWEMASVCHVSLWLRFGI